MMIVWGEMEGVDKLEINLIDYTIQIILSILCVAMVILFYIRKRKVGVIVGKASSSRVRFLYFIMGISMLLMASIGLYRAVSFRGIISDLDIYIFITGFLMATSFIINFLTSQIHIGLRGVSVPVLPLFIPRNQIIEYEVSSNSLVLRRKGKRDFKIAIEINDVNNIESAIKQLQNASN